MKRFLAILILVGVFGGLFLFFVHQFGLPKALGSWIGIGLVAWLLKFASENI